jgi:hypothetical protein
MKTISVFADAVAELRESGGGMVWLPPTSEDSLGEWVVGACEDLRSYCDDPRESTRCALAVGGMTTDEIDRELVDWKE